MGIKYLWLQALLFYVLDWFTLLSLQFILNSLSQHNNEGLAFTNPHSWYITGIPIIEKILQCGSPQKVWKGSIAAISKEFQLWLS